MVILKTTNLTWANGQLDDPEDMCAHGNIHFQIGSDILVKPDDGEWTVSASALYLLRTLEKSHTFKSPLFDHLFPCCGFNMFNVQGEENVVICGCPNGIDFEIIHIYQEVVIRNTSKPLTIYKIPMSVWSDAVIAFSSNIRAFYEQSSPKQPDNSEDKDGYNKFIQEWNFRHEAACSA